MPTLVLDLEMMWVISTDRVPVVGLDLVSNALRRDQRHGMSWKGSWSCPISFGKIFGASAPRSSLIGGQNLTIEILA